MSCDIGQAQACPAFWMIHFAAKMVVKTVHAFEWARQSPKSVAYRGHLDPIYTWFLGPTWICRCPSGISIGSAVLRTSHKGSQRFWMSRTTPKLPLRLAGSGPHLIHGSFDPSESAPKRHLDRFSHFCTAHEHDQPTHRPTDNQTHTDRPRTPSVAIGCYRYLSLGLFVYRPM